ncbi:MAG: hypothetical protein ABI599_03075 [Flavobacteriales bacterium]
MKHLAIATLSACAFTCAQPCQAQSKPLFEGAEVLDSCVVELPLTYAKKDKERYTQAARYLENDELIYLTYDKKSHAASYARVYVVVDMAKDSSEFVYMESAKDHLVMGGAKQASFPQFKASTQRFYNAACFDKQLAAHPELNTVVQEEKP